MKTRAEFTKGVQCKLGMMGVHFDGPCHVKANNSSESEVEGVHSPLRDGCIPAGACSMADALIID